MNNNNQHITQSEHKSKSTKKSRTFRIAILGSVLLILVIISYEMIISPSYIAEKAIILVQKEEVQKEIPPLTAENVYIELLAHGVKEPEIVVKQSILETGWYKCKNCSMAKNNIFGFRKNKKYIAFDNWVEGIAYYKKWQDKNYKKEGNYYTFLSSIGYATSTEYISKLKSVILDFDKEKVQNSQLKNALLVLASYIKGKQLN